MHKKTQNWNGEHLTSVKEWHSCDNVLKQDPSEGLSHVSVLCSYMFADKWYMIQRIHDVHDSRWQARWLTWRQRNLHLQKSLCSPGNLAAFGCMNKRLSSSILMCCSCFYRHPVMAKWPVGHNWFFMKLELIQVWLQDWIGGTSLVPLEDYFKATPFWENITPSASYSIN